MDVVISAGARVAGGLPTRRNQPNQSHRSLDVIFHGKARRFAVLQTIATSAGNSILSVLLGNSNVTNGIWNASMTSGLPNYEAPDREAQPVRAQDREVELSSGLK